MEVLRKDRISIFGPLRGSDAWSRIKVVTRLRDTAGRLQPDVPVEGQSETLGRFTVKSTDRED